MVSARRGVRKHDAFNPARPALTPLRNNELNRTERCAAPLKNQGFLPAAQGTRRPSTRFGNGVLNKLCIQLVPVAKLQLIVIAESQVLARRRLHSLVNIGQVPQVLIKNLGQHPQLGRLGVIIIGAQPMDFRNGRVIAFFGNWRKVHALHDAFFMVVAVRPESVINLIKRAPRMPIREDGEKDRCGQFDVRNRVRNRRDNLF